MHADEKPRFLKALAEMALVFADEISKPRGDVYWDLFRDSVTLAEWEYACYQAITRETFHKIPLPASMMTYVEEYRSAQHQQIEERWRANQRQLETAERLALEADPVWQAQERQRKEDLRRMEEAAYAKLARTLGADWRDVDTHHQIPGRITGENLTYTPQTDTEAAKARLRAQIAQVMAEEAQRKEEA